MRTQTEDETLTVSADSAEVVHDQVIRANKEFYKRIAQKIWRMLVLNFKILAQRVSEPSQ